MRPAVLAVDPSRGPVSPPIPVRTLIAVQGDLGGVGTGAAGEAVVQSAGHPVSTFVLSASRGVVTRALPGRYVYRVSSAVVVAVAGLTGGSAFIACRQRSCGGGTDGEQARVATLAASA